MKANQFINDERANLGGIAMGAVLSLIVVGVMLYVGISIMEGVTDSAALESGDMFYNTSNVITTGVASAFGLTSVLMLVIIASAIIGMLLVFVGASSQ